MTARSVPACNRCVHTVFHMFVYVDIFVIMFQRILTLAYLRCRVCSSNPMIFHNNISPAQSYDTSQYFLMLFNRRWQCYVTIQFMKKSLTTWLKVTVLRVCIHKPGFNLYGQYRSCSKYVVSSSFYRNSEYGSPYMPQHISKYKYQLCTNPSNLYSCTISLYL